jgi:hypothetical protein
MRRFLLFLAIASAEGAPAPFRKPAHSITRYGKRLRLSKIQGSKASRPAFFAYSARDIR